MTTAAIRNLTCALVIFCADVLVGAWQAPHFDGLSVLLIIGVDAVLWLALVAVPKVIAANRQIKRWFAEAQARTDARRAAEAAETHPYTDDQRQILSEEYVPKVLRRPLDHFNGEPDDTVVFDGSIFSLRRPKGTRRAGER